MARAAPPACRRIALSPQPGQITSMTWSLDGRELILTDGEKHELIRYTPEGRLIGKVEKPSFLGGDYKPAQVHPTANGFLVRNGAYDWIWLDRDFKPLRSVGPSLPKFAVINEVLVREDQLAGFGSFRKEDGSWGFGILQVRLSPRLGLEKVVEEVPYASKGGDLNSASVFISALASGSAYALRFEEPSYLLDVGKGRRLKAFPQGFDRLPSLPRNTGEDATVPRARVLEASTIPVALYGRGPFLYLLTRQPRAPSKTLWRLHRIDPGKDTILDSFTLPTEAANLGLASGPAFWAILEESSLVPSGRLHSGSLLLVPATVVDQGGTAPPCN